MPNRLLRDWTDSLRLDGLSAEAERLFIRLIMKADDYGRYYAESRLLRAGCFPLSDNLRANDIDRWLDELSTRQLILRYEVAGRCILSIINFGQRLRTSQSKFPPPAGKPVDFQPTSEDLLNYGSMLQLSLGVTTGPCDSPQTASAVGMSLPLPATGGNSPPLSASCGKPPQTAASCRQSPQLAARRESNPETDRETNAETETRESREGAVAPALAPVESPTEQEFIAECARHLVPEDFARDKFLAQQAKGWQSIRNWRALAQRAKGWFEDEKTRRFTGARAAPTTAAQRAIAPTHKNTEEEL